MALAVCRLLCTAIHPLKQPVASADHAGASVAALGVVAGVGVQGHVVAGGATGDEFAVGNRLDLKRAASGLTLLGPFLFNFSLLPRSLGLALGTPLLLNSGRVSRSSPWLYPTTATKLDRPAAQRR